MNRHLARILTATIATLAALIVGEAVLRTVDGYVLFATHLQPRRVAGVPDWSGRGAGFAQYDLASFVAEWPFADDVDPRWLVQSPGQIPTGEVRFDHEQRYRDQHWMTNYVWNERYLEELARDGGTAREGPFLFQAQGLWTFTPSWGTAHPRFRYPANSTLPPRQTPNPRGWPGEAIAQVPPPDRERNGSGGASTTASNPLPLSYPELLQLWLDVWALENGRAVRFEVINAGRESFTSDDIAAVVRHELLPVDLDYLIYYEGANELRLDTVITLEEGARYTPVAAGVAPKASPLRRRLESGATVSAWARRAVTVIDRWGWWPEPTKPRQTFELHRGIDEHHPELDKLTGVMGLETIVHNLDRIHADARQHDVRMVMTTFAWLVDDGLALNPRRHGLAYTNLNREPFSYANLRRAVDLQNRVYRTWAADRGVDLIDLAALMPAEPDLSGDGLHANEAGIRVRAWIVMESLLPLIVEDLEAGRRPRPASPAPRTEHPGFSPARYTDLDAFPIQLLPMD